MLFTLRSASCAVLLASLPLSLSVSACSDGNDDADGSSSAHATSASSTGSGGSGGAGGAAPDPLAAAIAATPWTKLTAGPTVSGGAKQDDLFFLDAEHGFAASGPKSAILATTDGGASWSTAFTHSGTYFRALLFLDAQHGFAGNIGAGLSPQIDDANVMYETTDGGSTWDPVTAIDGPAPQGVCNFTAVDATHLFAVGRANGPAHLVQSSDAGATWTSRDLGDDFSMIIDAHFSSPTEGVVAGMDAAASHCTIMRTTDGGETFDPVFTSATKGSLCWKLSFPSADVGYAAVQDTAGGPGTFAKTTDGGATWAELPLPAQSNPKAGYGAIGVGFIDDRIGWMASEDPGQAVYRTFDGGTTWEEDPTLKSPINRFRFVDAHTAYAIGAAVWKLELPGTP